MQCLRRFGAGAVNRGGAPFPRKSRLFTRGTRGGGLLLSSGALRAHLPAHDAREHPGAACVQLAGATLAKGTDDGLSLGRGIPLPDVGSPPLGRFSISHR
jgi:hypothetical protein